MNDRGMSKKQFAERIGVSTRTVNRWMSERKVSHIVIGGKVIFLERHFDELMQRYERKTRPAGDSRK